MKRMILIVLSLFLNIGFGDEHLFAGRHWIASYLNCDLRAISDLQGVLGAMDEAVRASGATVLETTSYIFPPNGLTVVFLLSESHASLHTYPEHGACFIDLFTCGDHCHAEPFDAILRAYLRPKEVNARLFLRHQNVEEVTYPEIDPLKELVGR